MRSLTVLLAALCLSAPLAAANWTYRGYNEPDTELDTGSWMFFDPDTSVAGRKIYFSAFAKGVSEGEFNANSGILGSRIQPAETNIAAILGFWKDCNNDGYVGQLETVMLEYRAELLLDDSICPRTTPVRGGQAVYPHNDGTWVRELIWIGPTKAGGAVGEIANNPTNFYADGTKIWGDWGLPGGSPVLLCPGGNTGVRSVGAILDNVDCTQYYRSVRTLNDVQAQTGAPVGGWEMQDIDNSPSPLNIHNPAYFYLYGPANAGPSGNDDPAYEGDYRGWGGGLLGRDSDEQRRERMVTLVDCESDTVEPSTDVNTPGDLMDPTTYPSLYESLNDTYEVAQQNATASNGGNACNPDGDADEGFPYNTVHPEGYSEPSFAEAGRVEVDHQFKFSPGNRNTFPAPLGGPCRATGVWAPGALGYCAPGDLGLNLYRHDGPIGPAWRTNFLINMYTMTIREQALKGDTPDMGGWYASFYAAIGPAAKAMGATPGGFGIYGAEACGENTSGIHNFWNCDENAWLARCFDGETQTQPEHCYRVGFPYDMRDVDCWDNTLARGSGVRLGISDLQPSGPCRGHPDNEQLDLPIG